MLFHTETTWSYPQFIGYGYASCLTCHYNGNGHGPLTDYGRALWATEIAGRAFSGKKSVEELGESSGFLGKKELPWWVRPGLKARHLAYQVDPPAEKTHQVTMQAEANVAVALDRDQKSVVVASFGYAPVPRRLQNSEEDIDEWISREHYVRVQESESLWFYVGMMDKVYGIRHADHTAFSRVATGLAQNDQTHGVVAQYIKPTWELSLHGFLGNLFQDPELRQKGFSGLFEYSLKENFRVGLTALGSTNLHLENRRVGVLTRYGAGGGTALMAELGLLEDAQTDGGTKTSYYLYSEVMNRLLRGYHSFFTLQLYKSALTSRQPTILKSTLGLLAFPMSRVEVRVDLENSRYLTHSPQVPRDTWALLGQLHLSL